MYIPAPGYLNRDFWKAVLRGDKHLLAKSSVTTICVPRYIELSLKKILPAVTKIPGLMEYLPDGIEKKHSVDRTWTYNVINSVLPGYLEAVIKHSQE